MTLHWEIMRMKEIWNEKADGQENLWYKGLFLYKPFLGATIACILVRSF